MESGSGDPGTLALGASNGFQNKASMGAGMPPLLLLSGELGEEAAFAGEVEDPDEEPAGEGEVEDV